MNVPATYITEARTVWRLLNGVICVYKPVGMTSRRLLDEVRNKLALGLNAMNVREPETIVEFKRIEGTTFKDSAISDLYSEVSTADVEYSNVPSVAVQQRKRRPPMSNLEKTFKHELIGELEDGPDKIRILKRANYADHTLVVGPRYQEQDIRVMDITRLGPNTSGLSVLGINRGIRTVYNCRNLKWLRNYIISGKFGIATNTAFHTGRIIDKSTFHRIQKPMVDRFLATTQASHQKNMFIASGIPLKSERAYEIASQGLPRPGNESTPLIYSLKCTNFDPPNFDIEMAVINENEDFLMGFVHDMGVRLRSAAVCTKIRCIKYGPFTLDLALLPKHYTPENFVNNMIKTNEILKTVDLKVKDPIIMDDSADRSRPPSREHEKQTVEYV